MNYQDMKAKARQKAIEWQKDNANRNSSYGELSEDGEFFYKLGKRYGLLTEFRENGII